MSLPYITFLHFTASEIQPGQDLKDQQQLILLRIGLIIVFCFFCVVGLESVFRWRLGTIKILLQLELWHGHITTLHTYNPQPMSPPSMNILYLMVSEREPAKILQTTGPTHSEPSLTAWIKQYKFLLKAVGYK